MALLIRWVIIAAALVVAANIVPGIRVEGDAYLVYAVTAIVLALLNALVKPILTFLSCPLILLTLGLFTIVINGFTLWLASYIAVNWLHVGFHVEGPLAALLGGLVVSIVTVILTAVIGDEDKRR